MIYVMFLNSISSGNGDLTLTITIFCFAKSQAKHYCQIKVVSETTKKIMFTKQGTTPLPHTQNVITLTTGLVMKPLFRRTRQNIAHKEVAPFKEHCSTESIFIFFSLVLLLSIDFFPEFLEHIPHVITKNMEGTILETYTETVKR